MNRVAAVLAAGVLIPAVVFGQARKPKDIEVASHWIYDDMPAAIAQARQSGKPILALFR